MPMTPEDLDRNARAIMAPHLEAIREDIRAALVDVRDRLLAERTHAGQAIDRAEAAFAAAVGRGEPTAAVADYQGALARARGFREGVNKACLVVETLLIENRKGS